MMMIKKSRYLLLLTVAVSSSATVIGSLTAEATQLMMLQVVEPKVPSWYEQPSVAAAIASGLFILIAKVVEKYWDKRSDKQKLVDQRENEHLSYSERMEEFTAKQWLEVIKKRDELHAQELAFVRQQNMTLEIAKYEYREKHNAAMTEVGRLQHMIQSYQTLMTGGGVKYEPADLKSYDQLLNDYGVVEKVNTFTQQLMERFKPTMSTQGGQ